MAQWVKDPTSVHEEGGSIPGPSQLKGSGIAASYGMGHRCGLDLALLWLWRRLEAMALI